jgi:hypothetical protein
MSGRYNEHWPRRDFLKTAGLGGAGALLGLPSDALAAEPPPETTKIRLARTTSICQALQYVVEGMFEAEGFTVVQFVGNPAAADRTLVSGDAQMGLLFLGPFLLRLDEDAPLLILSGGHVGCLELVAHEPIRSVRDLKGRSVAVVALGNATHAFLAMITAYVGLDPRKDVTIVTHSPRESMRLFEEKKVDAYITFPPFAQELRAKKIGQVVVNSSVDALGRSISAALSPDIRRSSGKPCRDQTGLARHLERSRALRARAGASCPIAGEPGACATLRLRTADYEGYPVRQMARVRPRGYRAVLRPAYEGGRHDQVEPTEDYGTRNRMAVSERTEEGTKGMSVLNCCSISIPRPSP